MNQTRRLILNVVATNGRTIYQLACGLLTGRWMLLALGAEGYGLLGLIGGLIAFMSVFNSVLTSSVSRYYTYSVGESDGDPNQGCELCQRWFNASLTLHFVVPLLIFLVGYPLGEWVVRNCLQIPGDRLLSCLWVFRFSCISCFVGLVCVPFRSMYVAKQEIAELTIYSFVTSTLHVVVTYYMATHARDWLVPTAAWLMLQIVMPSLIVAVRALFVYRECRIVPRYMVDGFYLSRLLSFAGWNFLGDLGVIVRNQGISILVNRFLGPVFNASHTVSEAVSGHAQMFSNEVNASFLPAITHACGAKNLKLMENLVHSCSKFSALLIVLVIVPLTLEMPMIVKMWLKNPPPDAAALCGCICWMCLINKITSGLWMAIMANGRIILLQTFLFFIYSLTTAAVWIAFSVGGGLLWVGYASVMTMTLTSVARIVLCHRQRLVPVSHWFVYVCAPILVVTGLGWLSGWFCRQTLAPSWSRVGIVCCVAEFVIIVGAWRFVLKDAERTFVVERMRKILGAGAE